MMLWTSYNFLFENMASSEEVSTMTFLAIKPVWIGVYCQTHSLSLEEFSNGSYMCVLWLILNATTQCPRQSKVLCKEEYVYIW